MRYNGYGYYDVVDYASAFLSLKVKIVKSKGKSRPENAADIVYPVLFLLAFVRLVDRYSVFQGGLIGLIFHCPYINFFKK